MQHIRHEAWLDRPADEVWGVIGDVGTIADWLPALAESRLEGDIRIGTMPDGTVTEERIVRRSDADRSYTYALVDAGALALENYESTIAVHDEDGRSRVVWSASFDADDAMRDALDGMYREGLLALQQHLQDRDRD